MRLVACLALLCLFGTVCATKSDETPPPVLSASDAQATMGALRAMLDGQGSLPPSDTDAAVPTAAAPAEVAEAPEGEAPVFSETESTVKTRFRELMSGALKPLLDDDTVKQAKMASQLDLADIPDEATKEKEQRERELQIASESAQKQAAFDTFRFQQAMRAHELARHKRHLRMLRRKRKRLSKKGSKGALNSGRRHRRHRHHHHHKHHLSQSPSAGSFFQQYYGHPRFQQILKEDEDEDEEEEREDKEEEEQREDGAEKSRFQQMQMAAKSRAQAEQQLWHRIEYGDSMNAPSNNAPVAAGGGYVEQAPGVPQEQEAAPAAGNAYGMPLQKDPSFPKVNTNLNFGGRPSFLTPPAHITHTAPVPGMRFQELHGGAPVHKPLMEQKEGTPLERLTSGMFQQAPQQAPQQSVAAPANMMRFQQVQNNQEEPQGESQVGNPNPGGAPMPFYPPSQAPPPAPNQMPAPQTMSAAMYPQNLVVAPSIGGGLANAGTKGAASEADRFMANNPAADVNQYPFNSFLQVDESELVHPTVYKLAYHPQRHMMRTPLTEEHMTEFPLLQ